MESSAFNTFVFGNEIAQSVTSLPAYTCRASPSPPPGLIEHVVESSSNITSKHAKPAWATLRVLSKAPSGTTPAFFEGEKITGSVSLDSSSSNSKHIASVKIIIRGELITGNHERDRITFLETTSTLWSKSDTNRVGQKLHWPFSLALPREVTISSNGDVKTKTRLPPTFMERNTRASIRYNLIVHITRTKFREDSDLQTPFLYCPVTKPGSPSPLRTLAYQENSPLLGPQADPEGWYSLPPAKVCGRLFNNRTAEVTCQLSLAKPLSYTRGSVIPLSLTLTSTDSQALDLLSSRQALAIKLRRKINSNHAQYYADHNTYTIAVPLATDSVDDIQTAIWWKRPGDDEGSSGLQRELEGEILLSKNLKPSFRISHFSTEYSVVMLPFNTTSFVPPTPAQKFRNGPVLEQKVEITTMYPRGPRPIAHSPPEYRQSQRRPSTARSYLPLTL